MSIEYRFHGSEHCLMCTASGEIHLDEILDYVDRVIDDQSVVGEFFEIVDFTQVKDFDFGFYPSREIMAKGSSTRSTTPRRKMIWSDETRCWTSSAR